MVRSWSSLLIVVERFEFSQTCCVVPPPHELCNMTGCDKTARLNLGGAAMTEVLHVPPTWSVHLLLWGILSSPRHFVPYEESGFVNCSMLQHDVFLSKENFR